MAATADTAPTRHPLAPLWYNVGMTEPRFVLTEEDRARVAFGAFLDDIVEPLMQVPRLGRPSLVTEALTELDKPERVWIKDEMRKWLNRGGEMKMEGTWVGSGMISPEDVEAAKPDLEAARVRGEKQMVVNGHLWTWHEARS